MERQQWRHQSDCSWHQPDIFLINFGKQRLLISAGIEMEVRLEHINLVLLFQIWTGIHLFGKTFIQKAVLTQFMPLVSFYTPLIMFSWSTLSFFIKTSKFCLRLAVLNFFSFLRLKCSYFPDWTLQCHKEEFQTEYNKNTLFHFFHSFSFKQRT